MRDLMISRLLGKNKSYDSAPMETSGEYDPRIFIKAT